jgi:hypothetical protein
MNLKTPMRNSTVLAIVTCLLVSTRAFAQIADLDPDWKELDVKPPAAFKTSKLVPIEMPRYVTVKMGIDPDTLTVSSDGIVRYVVVAVSGSGNVNAAYEGIWCRAGDVKTYARAGNDGKWDAVDNPEWKKLNASQPSMHALALARQGVCDGRSASGHSPRDILAKLRQSTSDGVQR